MISYSSLLPPTIWFHIFLIDGGHSVLILFWVISSPISFISPIHLTTSSLIFLLSTRVLKNYLNLLSVIFRYSSKRLVVRYNLFYILCTQIVGNNSHISIEHRYACCWKVLSLCISKNIKIIWLTTQKP